jgi:hypothetical protein
MKVLVSHPGQVTIFNGLSLMIFLIYHRRRFQESIFGALILSLTYIRAISLMCNC